jgi:hypothetical protein
VEDPILQEQNEGKLQDKSEASIAPPEPGEVANLDEAEIDRNNQPRTLI